MPNRSLEATFVAEDALTSPKLDQDDKTVDSMIEAANVYLQHNKSEGKAVLNNETAKQQKRISNEEMEDFPILPFSLVPMLDDGMLKKCESELLDLIRSLTNSEDDQSIFQYASKELNIVKKEINMRKASERLTQLFSANENIGIPTPASTKIQHNCFSEVNIHASNSYNNLNGQSNPSKPCLPVSRRAEKPHTRGSSANRIKQAKNIIRESKIKFCAQSTSSCFVIQGTKRRRKKIVKRQEFLTEEEIAEKIKKDREERRKKAQERLQKRKDDLQEKRRIERDRRRTKKNKVDEERPVNNAEALTNQKDLLYPDSESESNSDISEDDFDSNKVIDKLIEETNTDSGSMTENFDVEPESSFNETPEDDSIGSNSIQTSSLSIESSDVDPRIRVIDFEIEKLNIEEKKLEKIITEQKRVFVSTEIQSNSCISHMNELNSNGSLAANDSLSDTIIEDHDEGMSIDAELNNKTISCSCNNGERKATIQNAEFINNNGLEAHPDNSPGNTEEIPDEQNSIAMPTVLVPEVDDDSTSTKFADDCDSEKDSTSGPATKTFPEWLDFKISNTGNVQHKQTDEKLDRVLQAAPFDTGDLRTSSPNPQTIEQESPRGVKTLPFQKSKRIRDSLLNDRKEMKECLEKTQKKISYLCSGSSSLQIPHDSFILKATTPPNNQDDTIKDIKKPSQNRKSSNTGEHVSKSSSFRDVNGPFQIIKKKLIPTQKTVTTNVPEIPTVPVVDYSSIYPSFHSIMSSFYETPLQSKNINTIDNSEDAGMRYQLKMFLIWKNIMNDFLTVFSSDKTANDIKKREQIMYYRINSTSREEAYRIIAENIENLNDNINPCDTNKWEELPTGLGLKATWNLLWTWSKPKVQRSSLLVWQKVNHFPGAKAITRKDLLKKNLQRYYSMGGKMEAFKILPETFILPHEYIGFVDSFSKRAKAVGSRKNLWIMKPVGLSRGRGISLFNDVAEVCYGEAVVVQQYIENPLLLDGYKFDLRIYVLVTSFNPLEAFLYNEGFVRICTQRYNDNSDEIDNLFVHLTNSSIQKHNKNMITEKENPINKASNTEAGGTKTSLAYLWKRLKEQGANVANIQKSMKEVIIKSLVCADEFIPHQVNSFELFGYDILIDENFKTWLIEVNTSPSLARENKLDKQIKNALIKDTVSLLNPINFNREVLIKVLVRRLAEIERAKKKLYRSASPQMFEEQNRHQLNVDLTEILNGQIPRKYGEPPSNLGNYEMLCPNTEVYNQVMSLKKKIGSRKIK